MIYNKIGRMIATVALLPLLALPSAYAEGEAQSVSRTPPAANFDRGTGTGEPSAGTARLLRLMKEADDGFNARNYDFFLGQRHSEDVKVLQFGVGQMGPRAAHRGEIDKLIATFPDMRVHNDPYDVQFGQGQWTVAMGKLSGTFTQPMRMPDGTTVQPTGKRFETFFTTVAKWNGDTITEEFVMFDVNDINRQIMP